MIKDNSAKPLNMLTIKVKIRAHIKSSVLLVPRVHLASNEDGAGDKCDNHDLYGLENVDKRVPLH